MVEQGGEGQWSVKAQAFSTSRSAGSLRHRWIRLQEQRQRQGQGQQQQQQQQQEQEEEEQEEEEEKEKEGGRTILTWGGYYFQVRVKPNKQ